MSERVVDVRGVGSDVTIVVGQVDAQAERHAVARLAERDGDQALARLEAEQMWHGGDDVAQVVELDDHRGGFGHGPHPRHERPPATGGAWRMCTCRRLWSGCGESGDPRPAEHRCATGSMPRKEFSARATPL